MPTGACGIQCDVCRLSLLGICSTCGSGRSVQGRQKAEAQRRILGIPCPILECAIDKGIEYCMRDCHTFPCNRFMDGSYPYSQGFLNMQKRRRKESPPLKTPAGYEVDVPIAHWEDLQARDIERICENALARQDSTHNIFLPFLQEYMKLDIKGRCLYRQAHGNWERIRNPLLKLVCLIYLLHAGPQGLAQKMVGPEELKTGHFFRGPHVLKTRPLVDRFGFDIQGFQKAADRIGGQTVDMADAAFVFHAFPKVPLYYLLWEGDNEFQPRLSILFDQSIEHHLTADAIWGLVTLVSDALFIG